VDDQLVGLEIRKLLLEASGHRVLTASTSDEALKTMREQTVDLIVLDYRLAETTGDTVACAVRQEWPNVPIIMLSGYPEVPQNAIAVADRFLVKGGPAQEFLDIVKAMLGTERDIRPSMNETIVATRDIVQRSGEIKKKSQSVRQKSASDREQRRRR
jgi:CheY-like chemotaxis protein